MNIGKTGIAFVLAAASCAPAQAWHGETHRRIVLDAAGYMKNHPGTTNYAKNANHTGWEEWAEDHALRRTIGRKMIPHAIAMTVHVLNLAALRL